jgi:MSHA pilin protein MshC
LYSKDKDVAMLKEEGFTIIELVIVIVLIGMISAYITFNWSGSRINLDGQAQQLASDLRYTQSLAMTQGERYKLVTIGNTYQIQDNSGAAITLAQGGTTVTLGSGIAFGSLTTPTLIYDGKGIPYNSGGTALVSNANFPLTADGQTETVVVTASTGRVIVQ